MDCIFCQIVEGEIDSNIIYQDDLITCFLDTDPIHEGHMLIVPNKHYLDVDEIPDETLITIMGLSKKIVKVIKEKYSPEGYSMMQNGGIFNDIGHYHLHIFPRYQYDRFGWIFSDIEHDVSTNVAKEIKELLTQIK